MLNKLSVEYETSLVHKNTGAELNCEAVLSLLKLFIVVFISNQQNEKRKDVVRPFEGTVAEPIRGRTNIGNNCARNIRGWGTDETTKPDILNSPVE